VTVAERIAQRPVATEAVGWGRALGVTAATAGGLALVYGLAHASRLTPPVDTQGLLSLFMGMIVLIASSLAAVLSLGQSAPLPWARGSVSLAAMPILVLALFLASRGNLTPVRADMVYKQALRFDAESRWDIAAQLYETAAEMAPAQDHYWLFAGRARLEQARSVPDGTQRELAFEAAFDRLETARSLAPRNTDHAANLARAYRSWAEATDSPDLRARRYQLALESYEDAVGLSPRNVQLYNEWGQVHAALGYHEAALALYEQSLSLDDRFASTFVLMGDLYSNTGEWEIAIRHYQQGVDLSPTMAYAWSRQAYAYAQIEDWDGAIDANLEIHRMLPNDYMTLRNLVLLYNNQGDYAQALYYIELAEDVAPVDDLDVLRQTRRELADRLAQDLEPQEP
jgi:tetratricopeptide (TPR) repeat protein